MDADTLLDSLVFQLTPTRTRCELVISSCGVTEKLASGFLKPFISHLKVAEEEIEKGGYSIVLEVASGDERSWFTKGIIERFVRFVSNPEVLERITDIEIEIVQIEESINHQCTDAFAAAEKNPKSSGNGQIEVSKFTVDSDQERSVVPSKATRESISDNGSVQGESSKVQLLRILENRKIVLQKEQGMDYARAAAAGFDNEHLADLVSFAEYFGALRLRKACLNIMQMYKRKHEAGLWLESMEAEALDSPSLSETSLAGLSAIVLNNNPIYQFENPANYDDPSNQNELNRTSSMPENGKAQFPTGIPGSNKTLQGNVQQSTMPPWPGQPPQYMQNFQSHMVGTGPPMQGFNGLPIQGIQIGSPYYQSYPGNPYWPQYIDDPRFRSPQRTESGGLSNASAGSKHYATGEEVGSLKSVSLSQGLTDQGGNSDMEKESMVLKNSSRRSSHRSSNKRSGMIVIRNINYIPSKRHDGLSEDSEPESDSDSEDVIDVSDEKHKRASRLSRKKRSHRQVADSCNSNDKDGKYGVSKDAEIEDDNSSWQVFQTCLLKEDEASQNETKKGNNNATHANGRTSLEPEMGVNLKEHITTEFSHSPMLNELEGNNDKPIQEIQSKEELLLPPRSNSTWLEEHAIMGAETQNLSFHKKSIADDSISISEHHSEIKSSHTVSGWDAGDILEHTFNRNDDQMQREKHNRQSLVDDSFMVSTRSPSQEHSNIEWRTQINMDSELPPIKREEHSSGGVSKNKPETSISWEPADLLMMPERNSERDSGGQSWNHAIDSDIQDLVNIGDKKHLDAELNGDVVTKENTENAKEQQEMKSKERRIKETQEGLTKMKTGLTARSGKLTKLSPQEEAQLRADKLRAFKAGLQKTKKEKEEEERKRIEQLKMQRQKRIEGRSNSISSKPTSNPRSSKLQHVKPVTTAKVSISFQKDRTNKLSTSNSLPRPSTKISSEAIKRLSSHKSKTSNHLEPGKENPKDRQSQSVQAKQMASKIKISKQVSSNKMGVAGSITTNRATTVSSKIATTDSVDKVNKKENGSVFNVKRSNNQGLPIRKGIRSGKSNPTTEASDNSDLKKRSLAASKRSPKESASKEATLEVHLDSNDNQKSLPRNIGQQALAGSEGSDMDAGSESGQPKGNMDVHAIMNLDSSSVLQIQENDQPMKSDACKVAKAEGQVNGSISDEESRRKDKSLNSIRYNNSTAPAGLVNAGFESIKVSTSQSTAPTEVGMSGSLNLQQLPNQPKSNNFHAPSFALQRCDLEEPYRAQTVHVSSLDLSPSESFKFCTPAAPMTPEKGIVSEEISTPKISVIENNGPCAIASDSSSASPESHFIHKPLPSSTSPVADDGKSDSHHSRKKWGTLDNGAKGFRRLLMFGRKSKSSTPTTAEQE